MSIGFDIDIKFHCFSIILFGVVHVRVRGLVGCVVVDESGMACGCGGGGTGIFDSEEFYHDVYK